MVFFVLPISAGINDFQDRLNYADKLFNESDYFRAYSEYRLLENFFPEKMETSGLKEKITRTLFRASQYSQLKSYFLDHPADTPPLLLIAGASAFRDEDPQASMNYLERVIGNGPSTLGEKRYGIARLILAADQAQTGHYTEAHETLKLAAASPDPAIMESAVKLKTVIDLRAKRKEKKTVLAGAFSIIPGGGLFYTGKYIEGAGTLLGGAASLYSGYNSLQKGDYVETGFWATAFLFFYIRNFISAINTANEYNKELSKQIPHFMENDLQIKNLIDRHTSTGGVHWDISYKF